MVARVLVMAGLNLDRGWPDESVGAGRLLREASSALLVEVAGRALDLDVDGLVVLGGLWDANSVRSSTVDEVVTVLGALPFPVVVVPDESEALLQAPPRALGTWPASVHWVGADEVRAVEFAGARFAFFGPVAHGGLAGEAVLAFSNSSLNPRTDRPIISSGSPGEADDEVVPVPMLVQGSGSGHPRAVLVTWDEGTGLDAEDVPFGSSLGETPRVTLDAYEDATTMTHELDAVIDVCDPLSRVVVTGRVGPRLLIPPALDWRPRRDDVTVVWEGLRYEFPRAEVDEQTVRAELIRRLAGSGPDEARRHQALALGLSSLEGTEAP